MTRLLPAAITGAMMLFAAPLQAQTYDMGAQFSGTSNPNGPWSYGYAVNLNSGYAFTLYNTVFTTGPAVRVWTASGSGDATPQLAYNSGATHQGGTTIYPGGTVTMHPGAGGEYSIGRFVVPFTDLYQISAMFFSSDSAGATTDVHVLLNGSPIFSGNVTAMTPQNFSSMTLALNAGSIVDFAVGRGPNTYSFDNTAVVGTVNVVPEPGSLALLAAGAAIAFCISRRRIVRSASVTSARE